MTHVREFVHDDVRFTITKSDIGDEWEYRSFCDGRPLPFACTIGKETASDAASVGAPIERVLLEEMERVLRALSVTIVARSRGV